RSSRRHLEPTASQKSFHPSFHQRSAFAAILCWPLLVRHLHRSRPRPQPNVTDLETKTRALFYKDPRPIACLEPNESGKLILPKEKRAYRTQGCRTQEVDIEVHPDPLCALILHQIREAEVVQAIDRARLIHRATDKPCRVLVLTNVVLPLTVHAFATWD